MSVIVDSFKLQRFWPLYYDCSKREVKLAQKQVLWPAKTTFLLFSELGSKVAECCCKTASIPEYFKRITLWVALFCRWMWVQSRTVGTTTVLRCIAVLLYFLVHLYSQNCFVLLTTKVSLFIIKRCILSTGLNIILSLNN